MYQWIARVSGGNAGEFALQFALENGKDQLQEFFPRVELSRYPDELRVTDVDVIVAYVRSMSSAGMLSAEEMDKLEIELGGVLAKDGAICISKDAGLFRAIKL